MSDFVCATDPRCPKTEGVIATSRCALDVNHRGGCVFAAELRSWLRAWSVEKTATNGGEAA